MMTRSVLSAVAAAVVLTPVAAGAQPKGQGVVTGERMTLGDAVECPKIKADDGSLHPVSYLSPDIPLGARVTVRGFYAVTTGCVGTVLVAEEVEFPTDN